MNDSEKIRTRCPKCGKKVKLPPEYLGQLVRCRVCRNTFVVHLFDGQTEITATQTPTGSLTNAHKAGDAAVCSDRVAAVVSPAPKEELARGTTGGISEQLPVQESAVQGSTLAPITPVVEPPAPPVWVGAEVPPSVPPSGPAPMVAVSPIVLPVPMGIPVSPYYPGLPGGPNYPSLPPGRPRYLFWGIVTGVFTSVLLTALIGVMVFAVGSGGWETGKNKGGDGFASSILRLGEADRPLAGEDIYRRLVRSVVMVEDNTGHGSGFVISRQQRLIVTNYHVVRGSRRVGLLFPLYDDQGEVITDLRKYMSRIREAGVVGDVLFQDPRRDLALVRVDRMPDKVEEVRLANNPAVTGSNVYSVGNSGLQQRQVEEGLIVEKPLLWRLTKGIVRGRTEYLAKLGSGRGNKKSPFMINCMVLETDAPINPGDSGGPVVNDRVEVVGVVSFFNIDERQVSGNIDLTELRNFLAEKVPEVLPYR